MVALAKPVGMYSEFKLTMYDVTGFQVAQTNPTWNTLWDSRSGARDALLAAWTTLWQPFYANEPFAVGYHLLNEPQE